MLFQYFSYIYNSLTCRTEWNAINLKTRNKLNLHDANHFVLFFPPRIKVSGKPSEALQSDRSWEKVILNLGKLLEAICNFTKDTYLPHIAGTVFGFFSLIAKCSSKTISIFTKLKGHCTFVASVVLLLKGDDLRLLHGVVNRSSIRSQRSQRSQSLFGMSCGGFLLPSIQWQF